MTILFVEQLTIIDCAFLDAQRGLVGESWIVDLELEGELDEQSMVLDFGEVKRRLKLSIDEVADHKLIVPTLAPELDFQRGSAAPALAFKSELGLIEHRSPAAAVCLVRAARVDAASLSAHLHAAIRAQLPANVHALRLHLRNEEIPDAYYHYTHGLKKHAGHCQRIAHGHRSRLEIRIDGQRDAKREQVWAESWRDIYLGSTFDLVARSGGRLRFEYGASEGKFALELPEERCELIGTDSTVECLAELIASRVAAERPRSKIEVRAYEGVMKGAVAITT